MANKTKSGKIQKNKIKLNKKKFLFYFCRIFPSIILATLFLLPMGMKDLPLGDFEGTANLINAYTYPFCGYAGPIFKYLSFTIYLVPFAALFLLVSLFIKDNINKILYIITYIALTIYLYSSAFTFMIYANTPRWFLLLPKYIYVIFGLSFLFHLAMSIEGILALRKLNPEFAEYKALQKEEKQSIRFSIKTKVTLTIIGTISVILLIFMALILNIYKKSYTEAVSSMGRAQAERAANLYVEAQGRNDKISTSFTEQKILNSYATTPFVRIDMITPVKKIKGSDGLYLEKIYDFLQNGQLEENSSDQSIILRKADEELTIPTFDEFSYTTATGKVSEIPSDEKMITAQDALTYIRSYMDGSYKDSPIRDTERKTCKYMYPVYFERKEGRLLTGFTIVTYYEELLMKSYFHARILVYSWSIIFLYVAVILSLLLADFIANPLLYLKTSVHKTSTTLAQILDGNSKITAENLNYTDPINSKDEIKEVSNEVKNMVGIMKRIIPYISFSTLQAADKDQKKPTSSRELCFLFTDIRGFTSLCENKNPKEVVEILNHYLDIETEIILNNGGDIDKFVGDEMMAFFSGPKKEINACKAAMEIRTAMRAQQQMALSNGDDYISMGIGINTGRVIFGSVGSKSRMDFTSIGDTVNLAARLESANKAYGSKAIITEAVYEKLKDTFVCRELDFITVKGKTEPVRIFEILQTKAMASDKLYDIKDLFEKGLNYYRKQDWDKAQQTFQICNEKYQDMPSIVFLDRISHFKTNPPPKKWDGVFVMKVK
ncbi:MAG: adenylate/guanylate cyclase domain-containing protein [Treponema sp.]|nr:adenylate/guanylate cyclase domain-containing protein [Treponema sp.]